MIQSRFGQKRGAVFRSFRIYCQALHTIPAQLAGYTNPATVVKHPPFVRDAISSSDARKVDPHKGDSKNETNHGNRDPGPLCIIPVSCQCSFARESSNMTLVEGGENRMVKWFQP